MSDDTRARRAPRWIIAAVAGFFGLLYAFAVWNGIAQIVNGWDGLRGSGPMMWIMWALTIVLPIVVFAVGLSVGRRRGVGVLSLVLLAGLTLVGVFWVNVLAYVTYVNFSALVTS